MHHRHACQRRFRAAALCTLLLVAGMASSHAASVNDPDDQYHRETQACLDGSSGQDQETCKTEARRALDARKKGALETDTSAAAMNASKRCEIFTDKDKATCLARMDARGSTSGSVAGGGILREVETVVIPPGAASVTVTPKTANPVILAPAKP